MGKITCGLFIAFLTVFFTGMAAVAGGISDMQPLWLIISALLCIMTLISLILHDIGNNDAG